MLRVTVGDSLPGPGKTRLFATGTFSLKSTELTCFSQYGPESSRVPPPVFAGVSGLSAHEGCSVLRVTLGDFPLPFWSSISCPACVRAEEEEMAMGRPWLGKELSNLHVRG